VTSLHCIFCSANNFRSYCRSRSRKYHWWH